MEVFPSAFPCSLLQFDCTNTLNDQLLERVTVQMEPSDAYDVICCIPAPSLAYNQPGMCYTLVRIPQDDPTAGEKLCPTNPSREGSGEHQELEVWDLVHPEVLGCFFFCVSQVVVFSRIIVRNHQWCWMIKNGMLKRIAGDGNLDLLPGINERSTFQTVDVW